MIKNYPYLNDQTFLDQVFHFKNITTYAKLIALDWNQNELEEIQGKVISSSFTLDGTSKMRRTGNLNIVVENNFGLNDLDSLYAINRKVAAEVGIKNMTQNYLDYPILWFPLGIYVLNTVSLVHDVNNLSLTVQMKDKMCLLNGQCGGRIPASTVFDNMNSIGKEGQLVVKRPLIYQIIQELVHHFGGQPLDKIIISDLDSRVKQVMKWTGAFPLYMVKKGTQYQVTIDADQYEKWIEQDWIDVPGSPFSYGHDVGFIYTDFAYPGELVCDAGAAITDVLDNIVSALGNYEYFYDVYGNFRFQQIKNYLNNAQSKYLIEKINRGEDLDPSDYLLDVSNGKAVYRFENSDLITSFNNSPQYLNIKNDIMLWGNKKSDSSNSQRIIRYHLAIDKKPKIGNTYEVFKYIDPQDGLEKWSAPLKYSSINEFPQIGQAGLFYYSQNDQIIYTWQNNSDGSFGYISTQYVLKSVTTKDWRTELYFQGVIAEPLGLESNYYYTQLKNQWPKLYNIVPDGEETETNKNGFRKEIINNFSQIDFFLDFIDTTSSVNNFSVSNIGRRGQVTTDNTVNCLFEPNIPDIVLIKQSESEIIDPTTGKPKSEMAVLKTECQSKGQEYYQVPDSIYSLLAIGGTFNSAYQNIRQSLHQYISYNETVSIACIPLYFLEPNTRIFIRDDKTGIYGDYMINNISFALDTGGTMSIGATRALERI